jgi:hypothetical protein
MDNCDITTTVSATEKALSASQMSRNSASLPRRGCEASQEPVAVSILSKNMHDRALFFPGCSEERYQKGQHSDVIFMNSFDLCFQCMREASYIRYRIHDQSRPHYAREGNIHDTEV